MAMRKSQRIVLGAGLGHDGTPSASVSSVVGLSRCRIDERIGCNPPASRSYLVGGSMEVHPVGYAS